MPRIDVVVETPTSQSVRARQLSGMFDVPAQEKCRLQWTIDAPIEDAPWSVGLIVGPSGAGKSTIARSLFGQFEMTQEWNGASVVDDIAPGRPIQEVTDACQAVGFNTIPAWLRPYAVLSNGEKFRASLARTLLEAGPLAVVDEFTSTVDRQVARIGSHAVQKYVRAKGRQFVAVTCHYDVVEWLQPDWILEPHMRSFQRRAVQRRPAIDVVVSPVNRSAWDAFAPFHYMSADLNSSAKCFVLFVGDQPAAFAGMAHLPHPKCDDIIKCSRLVCLPDFQGLGLAPRLVTLLGAVYAAHGKRVRSYPAHPALTRTFDKSPDWRLVKRPGDGSSRTSRSSTTGAMGGRPCAVFEYCGPTQKDASNLIQDASNLIQP